MINSLKALFSIICIFALVGCSEKYKEDQKISNSQEVVNNLAFVKHEKSGLCFAYAWHGGGYGGPAFTKVSCGIVEEHKNTNGDNEKSAKELVNDLTFVKDKKTELCFAYAWFGGGYGGPAFTEVPCYDVEALLK